jgi:hypothetical protein
LVLLVVEGSDDERGSCGEKKEKGKEEGEKDT